MLDLDKIRKALVTWNMQRLSFTMARIAKALEIIYVGFHGYLKFYVIIHDTVIFLDSNSL